MLFINFNGAGWLFPFYFGVAQYLQEILNLESGKIMVGGVSAGSVTAVLLLLEKNFENIYEMIIERYGEVRYNPFKMKECLNDVLMKYIPDDSVLLAKCNNKLVVGMSTIDIKKLGWKCHEQTCFRDKKSIIDAVKASCHIPLISGLSPYYVDQQGYFDGGLAGLSGKENMVNIYVDIVNGNDKICPEIIMPELWRYYPCDPFIMKTLHKLGYEMAIKFIWTKNSIFKPYFRKGFKKPDLNTIHYLQQTIEYSKRKNEICSVKNPTFTILKLFNIKQVLMIAWIFIGIKLGYGWVWRYLMNNKKRKNRL